MTPINNINSDAELDAINDILSCVGEGAVTNIIAVDENADVANALRCLRSVNESIQEKGWSWNIDDEYVLQPDLYTKRIPYQENFLVIQAAGGATPSTLRNRNGYVYDYSTKTDKFDSPLTVRAIILKNLDEMPHCFRDLITIKASRMFNSRFFGDVNIDAFLTGQEREAYTACMEYELDYGAFNMITGDSWTSGRISR